jgi:hypothetical protein
LALILEKKIVITLVLIGLLAPRSEEEAKAKPKSFM